MADIAERFQLEVGLASDLAAEMRPMADQLAVYLRANPGSPNIPASFWQELKDKNTRLLALWLLVTWETSSRRHGWSGQAATAAGLTAIRPRAEATAQSVVDTARQRLDTATREWQARTDAAKPSPDAPATPTSKPFEIDQDEIDQRVEEILGPKPIERTAVTEVSNTITDASDAAMDSQGLLTDEDIWEIEDGSACKICKSVNKKPRSIWQRLFEAGPPAHPRCRCRIRYKNEGLIRPTGDFDVSTGAFVDMARGF